uniref:Protein transport protein Sec61 subunit gamma n=1 Tax=Gallus gallus TaxID=9031 RepID=A0A8V0XST0_CHICK
MDQVMQFVEPSRQFVKDSIRLVKRCTKPDRKEFQKIAMATAIGFAIMGFIGFFVKLIHIPINNIIVSKLTHFPPWNGAPPLYHLGLKSSPVTTRGRLETADKADGIGLDHPLNSLPEPSSVTSADAEEKFCQLEKELEQCKRNITIFAFPNSNTINPTNTSMYPLREVSMLSGDTDM